MIQNDQRALYKVVDDCWEGRLPVHKFPPELKRQAWRIITDRVWRAARDILKHEKVFRLRALREEYHTEFHELIKAEMKMLHGAGWSWVRDDMNRKTWQQTPPSPPPQTPGPDPKAS